MKSLPRLVLSKHSHRRWKHSFWGQVWISVDAIQSNPACGIAFPLRDQEKPVNATYRFRDCQTCSSQNKTCPCPRLSTVPTRDFFGNKSWKIIYFPRKVSREGEGEAFFDPTASSCFHSGHPRSGQITIGCLGGSRAAGSVPRPAEVRPLDADKAFLFIKSLAEKNQSQKLQCGAAELSDLMLQSG